MVDEPDGALVPVATFDADWQPIFHASNQVVLYHPTSHALSIRQSSQYHKLGPLSATHCPYCNRALPSDFEDGRNDDGSFNSSPTLDSRVSNYFQLLAIANEISSRPSTPPPTLVEERPERRGMFAADTMAEGYFKAFFQEERRLGMGANGTVFLCQHVLDGNSLGLQFAPRNFLGRRMNSDSQVLREVRLLERLHHRNIITYHHAWLETCQFSSFGPKVPTLHLLMQWAEGGSLDDFIDARLGRSTQNVHVHQHPTRLSGISVPDTPTSVDADIHSRFTRIRAFRAFQRAPPAEREWLREEMDGATNLSGQRRTSWTAVHLLSADEVKCLLGDVTEGLTFLHDKSILHLDLKPGNVLLTWDEGKLIPRAMLSDFGTSRDMLHSSRPRTGNTGTLEYAAPESLPSPQTGHIQQVDSKADMWSLGMILHKLLFFRLPYRYASEGNASSDGGSADAIDEADKMHQLEKEVLGYSGFKSTQTLVVKFEARRLPRAFLVLLESLLDVTPSRRPSCERVSSAIHEGKLDPLPEGFQASSFMPIVRRPSSGNSNIASPTAGTQDAWFREENQIHNSNDGPSKKIEQQPYPLEEETSARKDLKDEKVLLLGLPAPTDSSNIWARAGGVIENILGTNIEIPSVHWSVFWMDMAKSMILVTKASAFD